MYRNGSSSQDDNVERSFWEKNNIDWVNAYACVINDQYMDLPIKKISDFITVRVAKLEWEWGKRNMAFHSERFRHFSALINNAFIMLPSVLSST